MKFYGILFSIISIFYELDILVFIGII